MSIIAAPSGIEPTRGPERPERPGGPERVCLPSGELPLTLAPSLSRFDAPLLPPPLVAAEAEAALSPPLLAAAGA
eukprot:7376723-Prymnesium_polylepis.1